MVDVEVAVLLAVVVDVEVVVYGKVSGDFVRLPKATGTNRSEATTTVARRPVGTRLATK